MYFGKCALFEGKCHNSHKITHALLPPSGWLAVPWPDLSTMSVLSVSAVCWGGVGCAFAFVSPMRALTSDI